MKPTKIAWWKKICSYLIEFELERVESDFDHELSLCLSDGRFQLNAANAIYSWEDKYDNFLKAFKHLYSDKGEHFRAGILDNSDAETEVLILGFGLGSIVGMLEKQFKKQYAYVGVEIDDAVIYLAEKYVTPAFTSPIQIIQAPGELFIQSTSEQYAMICVDIFINDKIPEQIKTYPFMQHLTSCLKPGGIVLFNHLANKKPERIQAKAYFQKIFKPYFSSSKILDVDGNYILMGKK